MKIDRQLGILSILLQKESVTAPYLSEMFEVSRRTINRDIEDLCKAGIPIVTRQGANGGISIIDGWLRRNVNGINVVFCVANAIGNRLKNVRGVLILTILTVRSKTIC